MSTDFHLFIFTFNETALILLRAPVIFTVSSFNCSVQHSAYSVKMQSTSLTEMTLLFSSPNV